MISVQPQADEVADDYPTAPVDLGPRALGTTLLASGIDGLADRGGHFHSGALIEIHDLEGGCLAEDFEIFRPGIARADKELAQGRRRNDNLFPALFETH